MLYRILEVTKDDSCIDYNDVFEGEDLFVLKIVMQKFFEAAKREKGFVLIDTSFEAVCGLMPEDFLLK